jgi:hypothetical protein
MIHKMNNGNRWNFIMTELISLQRGIEDPQPIVELYVNQVLLSGYNISKKSAKYVGGKLTK